LRIAGYFRSVDNAPCIITRVNHPSFTLTKEVRFLVDSGASATIIADIDAARLGIDYDELEQLPGGMKGVGGSVSTFVLPGVNLLFLTEDGFHEEVLEKIYVIRHPLFDSGQRGIPSLLGRDILNKYSVFLRHETNTVLITDEDEYAT